MTRDFQQCGILTNVNSDEPVKPPFKLRNSKWCSVSSWTLNIHRIFKQLANALIGLRVCSGWSEPLLVAHTTLLEISCHGSFVLLMWLQADTMQPYQKETKKIKRRGSVVKYLTWYWWVADFWASLEAMRCVLGQGILLNIQTSHDWK